MSKELPLPPKNELVLAHSESKTVTTITCPHCNHEWEVVDVHDGDCSKMDPIEVIEQCPKCNKWMKIYDDDTAIDMFYEDYEGDPQWWEKDD